MVTKISIALNVLLLGLGIVVTVQLSRLFTHQDTLSQRVTDLEVQNVQLAKQFSWIAENRPDASPQKTGRERGITRDGASGDVSRRATQGKNATSGQGAMLSPTVADLKADLREEVEDIVAAHQTATQEKQREEWQMRMREGMVQSLEDFAEDQQLNDGVKDSIRELINESMTQRQNLFRELEEHNMSFYEFMQEERKMRREMEDKVSELLTDEQMQAFEESFPLGPRGGRGRRR